VRFAPHCKRRQPGRQRGTARLLLQWGTAAGYSSADMADAPLLPILFVPDPRLRAKARPVGAGDMDTVRELAPRMLATMYKAPGIGLAAPQVGVLLRMAVVDIQKDDQQDPMVLINPEIVAESNELATREEGCLSLPNQYADVTRPARIKVRWLALDGSKQEMEADDLLATCIQHELDHLDGVLFVDHISALKRNMLLRKLAKELKAKSRDGE
jgi:peptide deformylase